jgi:ketosteroid isomerase-like protein
MSDELAAEMARFQQCIEKRDPRLAEEVLDDDYALVLVHPSAATVPRQRWLEVLPEYRIHSYRVDECHVDVDGDVGTVLQRVEMSATVLGEDRSGEFVMTDVWRRRDGRWRIWRRHSTPLVAGRMPGA